VDGGGLDLADFDNMLRFDNRNLGIAAHHPIEVGRGVSKLAVAKLVCLPRLNKGVVSFDRLFHDVAFAIEDLHVSGRGVRCHGSVSVMPQW
jgi:hypothetical protein